MTEGLFWLLLKYFTVKLNNVKMLHMCPPNDKIVPTPMHCIRSIMVLKLFTWSCLTLPASLGSFHSPYLSTDTLVFGDDWQGFWVYF